MLNNIQSCKPVQADSGLHNSSGFTSNTPPIPGNAPNGQSVENAPIPSQQRWFVARITHGRARTVYETLSTLHPVGITPYLPVTKKQVCHIVDGKASLVIEERPVHTGLLFLNASPSNYRALFRTGPKIPGLTPFYDHFSVSPTGRDNYLVVPERQFDSFRRIIESRHTDILIDQNQVPTYLTGKRVRVISGPFAGVEGTLLKWKHQRRVFVDLGQLGKYATAYIRNCELEIL